ncbi:MAG: AI-2E family transporter [Clostridia bacterium]|jgi:predicted PurR-regulated permease PerM|nr:AI-2E family transporter [Clostridia bacterium]
MKAYNKRLFNICLYSALTAVSVCTAVLIMAHIGDVFRTVLRALGYILNLFSPLFIAIAAAFILDPVVDFFQNETAFFSKKAKQGKYKKRIRGTAVTYIVIALLVLWLFSLLFKSFGEGLGQVSETAANFGSDLRDLVEGIKVLVKNTGLFGDSDRVFQAIESKINYDSQNWLFSAAANMQNVGSALLKLGIGLVAAFYFLMDKERMLERVKNTAEVFIPPKILTPLENLFSDINVVFSGYIAGQIMDAVVMAILISASLWVLGVKYFLIIGLISGFSNLIPYLGAVAAFILAVLASAVSGNITKAIYAAVIILILQQIDAAVIVPKIVGKRVRLHPVIVLLSLSIAGSMFGIVGMVFAVPIAALLKLNFDRLYKKKKDGID